LLILLVNVDLWGCVIVGLWASEAESADRVAGRREALDPRPEGAFPIGRTPVGRHRNLCHGAANLDHRAAVAFVADRQVPLELRDPLARCLEPLFDRGNPALFLVDDRSGIGNGRQSIRVKQVIPRRAEADSREGFPTG